MNRRYVAWFDEYVTEWEGWRLDHMHCIPDGGTIERVNASRATPENVREKVADRVGVYAILYKSSPGHYYVAYLGYSASLPAEIIRRLRDFRVVDDLHFNFTVRYIPNSVAAKKYELDLIRYYCPFWNTRFSIQG
jgi:hypothetical protein